MTPLHEAVVDASVAPALPWTECANGLRRLACTVPTLDADRVFDVVSTVPVGVVKTGLRLQTQARGIGGILGHPNYDCLHLALALDRSSALAAADRHFIRVVTRAGVLPPDRLLVPLEGTA